MPDIFVAAGVRTPFSRIDGALALRGLAGSAGARVTQAFLKMKKFDIAALQAAYDGK